jgi:hypothetical protein
MGKWNKKRKQVRRRRVRREAYGLMVLLMVNVLPYLFVAGLYLAAPPRVQASLGNFNLDLNQSVAAPIER